MSFPSPLENSSLPPLPPSTSSSEHDYSTEDVTPHDELDHRVTQLELFQSQLNDQWSFMVDKLNEIAVKVADIEGRFGAMAFALSSFQKTPSPVQKPVAMPSAISPPAHETTASTYSLFPTNTNMWAGIQPKN